MFTDMPEEALRLHRSAVQEPPGFDAFWTGEVERSRGLTAPPRLEEVRTGLTAIRTWDVEFSGWGGQRVRGWLRASAGEDGPLPAVVEYVGYGGGRGSALENLTFAAAGYAHLLMDTRGQGSGWSEGVTPDDAGTGPQIPGVMTRGIGSPATYYYTRFFTDAVLAVDAARALMASRIAAPLLVTAALMDEIVPPSGPFAAFNASPSEAKELLLHRFNGHEGGGPDDVAASLAFIARHLAPAGA